jgi:hypothetical protein
MGTSRIATNSCHQFGLILSLSLSLPVGFELAFSTAYLFQGCYPNIVAIDDVAFLHPVAVGSILSLNALVAYTEVWQFFLLFLSFSLSFFLSFFLLSFSFSARPTKL